MRVRAGLRLMGGVRVRVGVRRRLRARLGVGLKLRLRLRLSMRVRTGGVVAGASRADDGGAGAVRRVPDDQPG